MKKLIITIIVLLIAGGAFYLLRGRVEAPVACTMEAKICPDGSAVGRIPPRCEFAACPTATSTTK